MLSLELCVVALLIICITHWIYKWRNPRCNGILPPGSMGFPLIGETLELIIPSYSLDIPPFIKKRLQRYGQIFRTNVAGRAVVVSADPEFNHFIFQQEGKLVEAWYFDLFAKLFKQGVSSPDGAYIRKYVINLTLSHFGAVTLKDNLLPQLEEMVNKTLSTWSNQASIEMINAAAAMAIEVGAKQLFSYDPEKSPMNLTEKFINFSQGLMSFPVNIPGTTYHKCLKDKEKALKMMSDVVKERRASPENHRGDLLDHVIKDMNTEKFITEEYIGQLMFGLLFVSFHSVSRTITLAFKFLAENPLALEALTAEHEAILKKRENPDSSITWEEYKSMTFTLQVINETLRLGSDTPGFLRRARKDIQVKGYTIPAGWAIMALTSAAQLNPNIFKDPVAFNPWRWTDLESHVISKNFMPFGAGIKQCAGAEYSRVLLAILLHVLVTKYRWRKIEGGDVVRSPILQFTNGVHIKISKKDN